MNISDLYIKMAIIDIFQSENSVFNLNDLSIILKESNYNRLKNKVNYYVKTQKLIKLRAGIYAKNSKYNKLELACKIYRPSYISLHTVLGIEGINFQFHDAIYICSKLNKELVINGQKYVFKKIKDSILYDPRAIINKDGYSIASKERAVIDTLYFNKDFYFDHLDDLDWDKCNSLLELYQNKSLEKRFKKLEESYQNAE
ncbi:MAG: hypothetical protein LW817_08590 [Candidatus Caenarcaniphilales bacterium]|nr:hypothetical protein [Candidatus Caenarcaniphilales bacterium]